MIKTLGLSLAVGAGLSLGKEPFHRVFCKFSLLFFAEILFRPRVRKSEKSLLHFVPIVSTQVLDAIINAPLEELMNSANQEGPLIHIGVCIASTLQRICGAFGWRRAGMPFHENLGDNL